MELSWNSFIDPDPESELLGVVGELRPVRYRTVPWILQSSRQIESQLAESNGLIGYTLRAELFRRRFGAVAVWESEESLQNFVANKPHVAVMTAFQGKMEVSRFDTFDVIGEEVPLEFDEAIARALGGSNSE